LTDGPKQLKTIASDFLSTCLVYLRDIVLPESDKTRSVEGIGAFIFDAPCNYDIILGRDFLSTAGIDLSFEHGYVQWLDKTILMKDGSHWNEQSNWVMALGEDKEENDDVENYAAEILEAKYEKTSPEEVVQLQDHSLDNKQKTELRWVLDAYPKLFDGTLGLYPHQQIHLELEENTTPYHAHHVAIPKAHDEVFKKELKHLVEIGVLRKCGATEWAAPTFIIPKKDGRVRWIADYRELNKFLKRRVYPLPFIQDVLHWRSGYKYFTNIDLTMFYYNLELDEASKELCIIVTPYGKFQYCQMAMGLKPSPDFTQVLLKISFWI
jgi:hypothetical protein